MKYALHTIVTAIAGIVFFLIGEIIYNNLIVDRTAPLTLPIYFIAFMIVMIIVLRALSLKRGVYFETRDKKKKSGNMTKTIIITLVVMTISSGVLELLYEIGGKISPKNATSYIFVIDDSGSMQSNDSSNERKNAIDSIMSEMDTQLPYSVYLFNDNCQMVKQLSTNVNNDCSLGSNGGTDIVGALKTVFNDYENQKSSWGSSPKVLLLTDGESSSFGLSRILKKYRKSIITISTVGFGSADSDYLSNIAEKTGGVYISSNQISTLKESMEEALTSYSDGNRNLLSDRFCEHDALYTFLRILFLTIISIMIAIIKSNAMYDTNRQPIYFLVSLLLGILASVLMEVLISHVYAPTRIVHFICCILWAVVPAEVTSSKKKSGKRFEPAGFDDEFSNDSDDYLYNVDQHNNDDDDSFNDLDF